MIRTFHAVGQGGFCTEYFEKFCLIYDCGSSTGLQIITDEVEYTFQMDEQVDAVFISHFNNDHINGLEFVLGHCDVKRVFLPLLTEIDKLLTLCRVTLEGPLSQFMANTIFSPDATIRTVSDMTSVVLIEGTDPLEEGEEFQIPSEYATTTFDELRGSTTLSRDTAVSTPLIPEWIFLPFNFDFKSRSREFGALLRKQGIIVQPSTDIQGLWKNPGNKKKIIDVFSQVTGNPNCNSLTLYSGPTTINQYYVTAYHYSHRYHQCYCGPIILDPGCLHLGDYEAKGGIKWKHLYNRYQRYWKHIGTVQIPHHGSRCNYNPMINRSKSMISVMNAGYSNRYRHPHAATIRDILVDGGSPVIVNEKPGSRFYMEISGI